MRLLADTLGAGRAFAAPRTSWRRLRREALPASLANAWELLAGDRPAWCPEGDEGADRSRDTTEAGALLVIDHAARSQFEALRGALRTATDLPERVATLALSGSGFRGQRDRAWQALRGNLHLCLLARLDGPAASLQAALTALPAVATAAAVERVSGGRVRPGLKWVNDLLVDGRKVGGVLTATQVQGGHVTHVLFGIGVNLARVPDLPRDGRTPAAGCLGDTDPALREALPELGRAILTELGAGLASLAADGAAAIIAAYRRRAVFVEREVAIWPVDGGATRPLATGRVTELLDDLGLRLAGHARPLTSGRMTLLDDAPAAAGEDA
jgi:biotin-(acetyl-CoA carboxylase) ligase